MPPAQTARPRQRMEAAESAQDKWRTSAPLSRYRYLNRTRDTGCRRSPRKAGRLPGRRRGRWSRSQQLVVSRAVAMEGLHQAVPIRQNTAAVDTGRPIGQQAVIPPPSTAPLTSPQRHIRISVSELLTSRLPSAVTSNLWMHDSCAEKRDGALRAYQRHVRPLKSVAACRQNGDARRRSVGHD